MPLHGTGPHFCPACPQWLRKNRLGTTDRWGFRLNLVEGNYSGTGVDVAACPNCRRVFGVRYQALDYVRMPDWESDPHPPRPPAGETEEYWAGPPDEYADGVPTDGASRTPYEPPEAAGYAHRYIDHETKKPLKMCPHDGCACDLTARSFDGGVTLVAAINETLHESPSVLDEGGVLEDVDSLVENGYHSDTLCAKCGESLSAYEAN